MQNNVVNSDLNLITAPKVFFFSEDYSEISEIEIEFFKSKARRLTSDELFQYFILNFSDEKKLMLEGFKIEELIKSKDIFLMSLIISSLLNTSFLQSKSEGEPVVFELAKISRIQSNNQFEKTINPVDKNVSFDKAVDTEFEVNVDDSGNTWMRNIFIDEKDNLIYSNWSVYSSEGKLVGEFDECGNNLFFTRMDWQTFKESLSLANKGIGWLESIFSKSDKNANELMKEYHNKELELRTHFDKKISEIKSDCEAKLEKKNEQILEMIEKFDKKISDMKSEYESKLEKKDEKISELKIYFDSKIEKKDEKINELLKEASKNELSLQAQCDKKMSEFKFDFESKLERKDQKTLELKADLESKLEKKDIQIQELNNKLQDFLYKSK